MRLRLTALALTLLQAAGPLGSLVAIVAWPTILRTLGLHPEGLAAWLATLIQSVVLLLTVLLSFALTFNVGPAARHRRVWVTPGTSAGAAAFLAFSNLFRVYVRGYGGYDRAYGSLGGIMVLVSRYWVVAMVLLGAAEMDRAIEDAVRAGASQGRGSDPPMGRPP